MPDKARDTPEVPWKRATRKQRSARSERAGAALEGGLVQPNSGAMPGRKGDYIANGFLVDDKFTDARSFSIKLDGPNGWLAIARHALSQGRLPSFRISMPGVKLRLVQEDDYMFLIANQKDAPK